MEPSLLDQYKEASGANKFLAEHCGKALAQQSKLLRGISHSANRCNAEYSECWAAVEELRGRCEALESGLAESNAAIGKLQEQIAVLDDSMNKARAAYAKLKKEG